MKTQKTIVKQDKLPKKTEGIKYLFWILIFISIFLIISPVLLNNTGFRSVVDRFTLALEKEAYKEGYIGLIGGLIGSALGVVGALFVMHIEQKKEREYTIRVNSRITYYDIELFYVEFAPLGKLFLAKRIPSTEEFNKHRDGLHLLINPNWISTVAELGDKVLNHSQIHRLYALYGVLQRLDSVLQTCEASSQLDKEKAIEIKALFHRLGRINADGAFTYHTASVEADTDNQKIFIGDIMNALDKQIQ